MKTSFFFILALLLFLNTTCEQEQLPVDSFKFELLPAPCVNGGMSFSVKVAQPDKYAYLWELDGEAMGHYTTTDCLCGNSITIYVTRLSDGLRLYETKDLMTCPDQDK